MATLRPPIPPFIQCQFCKEVFWTDTEAVEHVWANHNDAYLMVQTEHHFRVKGKLMEASGNVTH